MTACLSAGEVKGSEGYWSNGELEGRNGLPTGSSGRLEAERRDVDLWRAVQVGRLLLAHIFLRGSRSAASLSRAWKSVCLRE